VWSAPRWSAAEEAEARVATGTKQGMKHGLAADTLAQNEGHFNMEKGFDDLGKYVEGHPEFVTAVVFWVITGNLLLVSGLALLLYSEIKMVQIVRSQEMTLSYYETQELGDKEGVGALTDAQRVSVTVRPYLTFIASTLCFLGVLLAMVPLCDVLPMFGIQTVSSSLPPSLPSSLPPSLPLTLCSLASTSVRSRPPFLLAFLNTRSAND
jgi:hypothetical protein